MYIENKKVKFDYFIEKSIEVGIVLKGWEVKSVKSGKFSFKESFVKLVNDECFIINLNISKDGTSDCFDTEETNKDRKLLLKKKQILNLKKNVEQKGYSLMIKSVYTKEALIKMELCLVKGKKNIDKRNVIKERDINRKSNFD